MSASLVRVGRDGSGAPALVDDEGPVRFALGNAYYLAEEAARGRDGLVEETFDKLTRLGVRVIRTWAFNDDPAKHDSAIRRDGRELHEPGLRGLDRVLARARAHGVRLILPLVNYWNAYGGTRQWCLWAGMKDAIEGDPRFYTDERVRKMFAAHVAELLERRNPETGVRYGEDPIVLAWELMNEPRGNGVTEDELVDWIRATGGVIRGRARQLISLGEEGHERSFEGYDHRYWRSVGGESLFSEAQGGSYSRHVSLPEIDLASVHFYPEKYGITPGHELQAGVRWIESHVAVAHAAGKPAYVGELGLANEHSAFARFSLADRRAIYRAWFVAAWRAGVAGIGPWCYAHDSRPDEWDDFTWYCKDGLPLHAEENRYADLVAELAAMMTASS